MIWDAALRSTGTDWRSLARPGSGAVTFALSPTPRERCCRSQLMVKSAAALARTYESALALWRACALSSSISAFSAAGVCRRLG